MSAVLADIQNILRKHRITAKIVTWHEADGNSVTKIILKDSAGIQSKTPPVSKKRKTPSRKRRDLLRRNAYAAKMAVSCVKDPEASRRFATPCRRLGTSAGTQEKGATWGTRVDMQASDSPIPQLDGGGEDIGGRGGGGGEDVDGGGEDVGGGEEDVGGGVKDVGGGGCMHNYTSDMKVKGGKFYFLIYCTSCYSHTVSID